MLLALDIGNSAVKGGLFDGSDVARVFHVDVGVAEPGGEAAAGAWRRALSDVLDDTTVDRAGVASVVPDALPDVTSALHDLARGGVTVVSPSMCLPFTLAYQTPHTLGADRLAAAAAAWVRHGRVPHDASGASTSVLAVDAGTAVTYEVIDRDGVYRGGVIGAGPLLVQRALRTGTAQLPTVPLTFPDEVVGRSTANAMQSGVMWAFVDGVRGMIDRLANDLPDDPVVVLTGGWCSLLSNHLDVDHIVSPHLVLDGVRVLLDLNPADAA